MRGAIRDMVLSGLLTLLLAACTSRPVNVQQTDRLPEIFPDYIGVTIPVELAPLNFCMGDEDYTTIDVEVKGKQGGSLHANGPYADFDIDDWHQLLKANAGSQIVFSVCAEKDGHWTQFRDFTVAVSRYPLDEWGITYRRIAPSYTMYSHMGLYQRDLSNFDETALLENTQVTGHCLNCHTANRTNPDQYVYHVRGKHGATVVHRQSGDEVLKARNDSLGGSLVYPYWHPGGRYCAFSTNKTAQMFHTVKNKRIEVYDSSSDVFVYDTETHTILCDTLTMRKDWVENTPAFSPDGQWLYFITARRQVFPADYDREKYSLCRVSFDAATGRLGTQVDTLVNTRTTDKSVTWPRPSYDGHYLMYTQTNHGYFSVWHPEADLWLLDLKTGETRCMDEVNSAQAESLHNWSANSRWFLFTSRRGDGLYTRVYFSSIGNDGKATKPFLLPQQDPRGYDRSSLYSFNTPDFTSRPVSADAYESGRRLENPHRTETKTREMLH